MMRMTVLGTLTLLFIGCPDTDDDDFSPGDDDIADDDDVTTDDDTGDDDDTTPTDDQDGDGWTPADGDCDDNDSTVYPGAAEALCDGVDSDCDGDGTGVRAVVGEVEYGTFADALAAAVDGNTLYVCPGTHTEQIYIDAERTLAVVSWSGDPGDTILDGQDDHTCLYTGLDAAVSVRDLTFQNGWAEPWCAGAHCGGGIASFGSVLEVASSVFVDNYSEQVGAAVFLWADADLPGQVTATIEDVLFEGNVSIAHGAGIRGNGYRDISIECTRCDFAENSGGGGAGICLQGYGELTLTVTDSAFTDNDLSLEGGAIDVGTPYNVTTTLITNSIFTGNTAENYGGAVNANNQLSFEMTDCQFSENSARNGGGLYLSMAEQSTTATIRDCTFGDNYAEYGGGGMAFSAMRDAVLTIEDTSFTSNTADYSGGGLDLTFTNTVVPEWGSTAYLTNVDVLDSYAGNRGGGININGTAMLDFDNCTLQGNACTENAGAALFISDLNDVGLGATLTDSLVDSNQSDCGGAALWCAASLGLTLIDSAITSNIGGGVGVNDACLAFVSDNTDFGVGATDNDSYDVWMQEMDLYYTDYGAGASFTCEGTGECY